MSTLDNIRPTKGYLLDLKRRVVFVEKGYQLLKLKRDNLAKELKNTLENLQGKRHLLVEQLKKNYTEMSLANMMLGPIELKGYALSIKNGFSIEILPKSIMGINYPMIKIISKPPSTDDIDVFVKQIVQHNIAVLYQLIILAELEAKIERIAEEFGRTNRKVNVLRDIIIPQYHERIHAITESLDAENLEELVRLKTSRGLLEKKQR